MKIGVFEIDGDTANRATRTARREFDLLDEQGKSKTVLGTDDVEKYQYIDRVKMHQSVGDTTGYYDKAKELMEQNKDLDFVQRALTAAEAGTLTLGNASHKMGYFGPEDNGDYMMFPNVIRNPENENELIELEEDAAVDHAIKTGEFVNIGPDPFFAKYMTIVGYKHAFPKEYYEEAMNEYIQSW